MEVRAKLIELWKKITPYKTSEKVYWNGEDNNYPEEMERVLGNSPTGQRAKEMFGKFIFGNGIMAELDDKFGNTYLSEIAKDVIDDVVNQYGSFIHTSYRIEVEGENVKFVPDRPKSLDYNKCRISEQDDEGYDGMILFKNYNKLDKSLTQKEKNQKKLYYPFNPNQKVVEAQIERDAKLAGYEGDAWAEKIKHYRGQVMYLNLTPKYRYAISKFDSVYNDLDTEYRIGQYCNTLTRGGFLGKTAILTQGLDAEVSENIKEDIKNWLGSEGSGGVYYLELEKTDDLDNVMKIIQVESQFDDKQFESIRKELRRNILGCANNLPEGLAFADESLFGNSGEAYKQMKLFYWEQCEWERQRIEDAFLKLGHRFKFLEFDNDNDSTE